MNIINIINNTTGPQEEPPKKNDIYIIKKNPLNEYIDIINARCGKTLVVSKNLEKSNDVIPTLNNYDILTKNNYSVQQLKTIAKKYKLKLSGNKPELLNRIYIYLKLSCFAVKIQKIIRGNLRRKYNNLHGPAFIKRKLCTNDCDFLTGDKFIHLKDSQFFSYKDTDGFIYGFDIISLYNLIIKSGKVVKNPYNRNNISKNIIQNIRTLIRISRVLKIPVEIEINTIPDNISNKKSIELKALDLFQQINSLGNYSDFSWFLSLNRIGLIKFLRELVDIWTYRAQLTTEIKRMICPPYGDPFKNLNLTHLNNYEFNIEKIQKIALDILDKLINSGIEHDNKSLGSFYVLAALTLVNDTAATSLPWLFQSVSHY